MLRRGSTRFAGVLALSVLVTVLAGCGGDAADTSGRDGTDISVPADPSTAPSNSHGATETTSSLAADGSGVVAFEVPSEVACAPGTTASVPVTYRTKGLQAVALVVDGQTQPAAAATSSSADAEVPGSSTVTLPCDGNVHTIMLIGSGADGPAFASKAVVTGAA